MSAMSKSLPAKDELPQCPVEVTLKMISSRWAVLILRELLTGTKRNAELLKSLQGISQKVLTSTLRGMEKNGLIFRTVYPEVPPRVEYKLTACGESLKPVLDSMIIWGNNYKTAHEAITQKEQDLACTLQPSFEVADADAEKSSILVKE